MDLKTKQHKYRENGTKPNNKGFGGISLGKGFAKIFPPDGSNAALNKKAMHSLDTIHIIFLLYSGAHNSINAWHRAENVLFFLFVLVGILSVELMLWGLYKHWKEGRMVGKMLRVGKYAGMLAMFYATAGILAQAQDGTANAWLATYYQWILPSSAPAMFVFAFWIQSVDPIMNAERDTTAHSYLTAVEERREILDVRRMELDEKRDQRMLEGQIKKQKIIALRKESNSRRTRATLRRAVRIEMPNLLERAGISIKDANQQPLYSLNSKYDVPKQLTEGKSDNSGK